ncbi:MAG: hypothetical protein JW762_14360 [Dehalococcoidales bacterium]|nr:hypothetical protein [Dehalococcoidales bacterium]
MPKINDVINKSQLSPLQQKVLDYLQEHDDEVFGYGDVKELSENINHKGSNRGVSFTFWALVKKRLIDKERVGKYIYFGSKSAIRSLREQKRRQNQND